MATKQCPNKSKFRYTWAGRDESYACEDHAKQIQGLGNAMGYYVQMIPLEVEGQCRNQVKDTGERKAPNGLPRN